MDHHRLRTDAVCGHCGATADAIHTQRAHESIQYSTWVKCQKCGYEAEVDAKAMPDAIRQGFYQRDGQWTVRVDALGSRRSAVLRTIRDLSGESPSTSARMLGCLPGTIFGGTRTEMEFAARKLRCSGAAAIEVLASEASRPDPV